MDKVSEREAAERNNTFDISDVTIPALFLTKYEREEREEEEKKERRKRREEKRVKKERREKRET